MPRATTRREDAPVVQLSGYRANAGEPLGPQVVHDGFADLLLVRHSFTRVRRAVIRVLALAQPKASTPATVVLAVIGR
jgi:hypothetical protein